MRTRARAWAIRAAVVAVVTAAGVVGIAAPAHAAPEVSNFGLSATTINPGQQVTATWTVYTRNANGETATVRIEADHPQVECSGDCSRGDVPIDQDGVDFTATFTATGVFASDTRVRVRIYLNNTQWNTVQEFTVRATPTVPEVKGTVTDVYTGEPVKDARVTMIDSAGTTWDNIGTGADGTFTITSIPAKPIAAGPLHFTVRKEGIRDFEKTEVGMPNQPLLNVSLRVEVIPTTTAATAPTESQSEEASQTPTSAAASASPEGGLSGFAIMMIVIGGLLVLTGIGAIVLLFVRKNDDDEDEDGPPGPGGRGYGGRGGPGRGGPPPPGQRRPGPPDRTQPMRPGYGPPRPGAPGARDQTVIARSPLADAPTQLHRPAVPPQPPYGGPGGPPPAGYPAQPSGAWAAPTSTPPGGYGPPPQYGPPAGPPPVHGPGHPQPGYGPPPQPGGYAEPRHGARPPEGRRVDWIDD